MGEIGIGIHNFENKSFLGAVHIIRNRSKIFTNQEQFYFKIITWSLCLKINSLFKEYRAIYKIENTNEFLNNLSLVLKEDKLVDTLRALRQILSQYGEFCFCEILLFDKISYLFNREFPYHYRRYIIQ